jgi:Tol biopolymer transport system component
LAGTVAAVQRRPYSVKAPLIVAAIGLVALIGARLLAPRFASDVSVDGRPPNSGVPDQSDRSEAILDAISKSAYAYERATTREQDADLPQPIVSQLTARVGREIFPSLSPDGKWIVYASDAEGNYDIYLQSVSGELTINLTKDSSADDSQPAFSPDAEQIAFRSERAGGGLFVMGRTGESVRGVSRFGFHPNWSPDGQSLVFSPLCICGDISPFGVSFAPHFLSPLAARLGTATLGIVDLRDEMKRFLPGIDGFQRAWSPKGDRIAFSRMSAPDRQTDIWTVPAGGGEPVPVTSDRAVDWNPVWSPSGNYLYFSSDRGGTMNVWRVQLDPQSGSALSRPEAFRLPSPYVAHLSIAQNARTMAFTAALPTRDVQRAAFDLARETLRRDFSSASTGGMRFFGSGGVHAAPDMKTIAFSTFFPTTQLFTARPDFSNALELTNGEVADWHPRWAPNGQEIAFYSERNGGPNIWIIRRDGTMMRQLTHYKTPQTGPFITFAWSPDGAYLAYSERMTRRVVIVATAQSGNTQSPRFMPPPDNVGTSFEPSSWSADGKWIAGHLRNRSKGIGIYSTESSRYQHVATIGEWPVWLNDNRRLLFSAQGKLYIVDRDQKRPRELLSVQGEHFRDINLSPDNREVFFVRQALQSDIWLVKPSQQ